MGCLGFCCRSTVIDNPKLPVIDNNLPVVCTNGHPFVWATGNTFAKYAEGDGWDIYCKNCKKGYSKPSWQCEECKEDLCETCGRQGKLVKPVLVCNRGHELNWAVDTCSYYQEKLKCLYVFKCCVCSEDKQEPSWHCRYCNYDVCIKCAREKKLTPPCDFLVCKKKHPLSCKKLLKNEDFQCISCEKQGKEIKYSCGNCQDARCFHCALNTMAKMMPHPGLRCAEDGEMLVLADISSYNAKNKGAVSCRCCNTFNIKYGYYCIQCRYCYCLICGGDISKFIQSTTGKLCKDGHMITWSSNPIEGDTYKCEICQKYFACGVFSCLICEISYCLNDVKSLN